MQAVTGRDPGRDAARKRHGVLDWGRSVWSCSIRGLKVLWRLYKRVELPFILMLLVVGYLCVHHTFGLSLSAVTQAGTSSSLSSVSHHGVSSRAVTLGSAQSASSTASPGVVIAAHGRVSAGGISRFLSQVTTLQQGAGSPTVNTVNAVTHVLAPSPKPTPKPIDWGPKIAVPSCNSVGPISFPFGFDPCMLFVDSFLALYQFVTELIAVFIGQNMLLPYIDPANPQANFLLGTPPAFSYNNQGVLFLYATFSLPVSILFVVLIIAWAGFSMVVKPQLGMSYQAVVEFLPRLVLGVGLAVFGLANIITPGNFITGWMSGLIQLVNVIDQAIRNPVILQPATTWPALVDDPTAAGIVFAFFSAAETILLIMILWQLVVRVAVIDVLLVCGPLAMVCWILPQTQRWTELWIRTFIGMLVVQPIQLLALNIGGYMVASLFLIKPPIPSPQVLILQILLLVALMSVVYRLPRLVQSTQAFNGNIMTLTGLYFAFRTLTGIGSVPVDAVKAATKAVDWIQNP